MPIYDDVLEKYVREQFAIEDGVLRTIRENIVAGGLPQITIKPEEGRFLEFIVAASGARLALEIGTLGGYSGTWIARGLPDDGESLTSESGGQRLHRIGSARSGERQTVAAGHDLRLQPR